MRGRLSADMAVWADPPLKECTIIPSCVRDVLGSTLASQSESDDKKVWLCSPQTARYICPQWLSPAGRPVPTAQGVKCYDEVR